MYNNCKQCGSSYEPRHKGSVYCGRQCANRHTGVAKTKTRKACFLCGKECKRPQSKLCSPECRSKHLSKKYNGLTLNTGRTHFKRTINKDLARGQTRNWAGYIMQNGKRQHRLIIQEHIGRPLGEDEDVHHVNGDKEDNRLENLMILSKREHTKLHARMKRGERVLA